MNDTWKVIAVFAALVAGVLAWQAWQGDSNAEGPVAWAGSDVAWGKPARYGCDPGWMRDMLPRPHPVYRQGIPGAARQGLIDYGWAWISDPPGEMGLGS